MNVRRFFSCVSLLLVLGGGLLLWHAMPALAQVDTAGFQAVGAETQLGTADPRVIASRIINIFLGTLGTILLCLIIYAGFLWTTAGGDAEKVEKAQKTIRNAIIGLIIILCSWGFVTFVINKLLQATGGNPGAVSSDDGGAGGSLGSAGGSLAFQVRSITPIGPVRIRNVEVRFLFSREVLASTATSSITVVRASDGETIPGTITVSDELVSFVPDANCPAPNQTRKCFADNTEYTARVGRSLRSRSGLTLACGTTVPACESRFKTGSLVDVSAPVASIINPVDGQSIPSGDTVRVAVRSTDDGGISLTDIFVDGRRIGRDAGSASTTPLSYDASVEWDTRGVATGTHQIQAHVWDVDSNSVTTTAITVAIRARNYFNGVLDGPGVGGNGNGSSTGTGSGTGSGSGSNGGSSGPGGNGQGAGSPRFGETGVDCGGPGGGLCAGAACTASVQCASGACVAGRCVEQPIIGSFNPADGRAGTFVTISGVNFGTSTGRVLFGGRVATLPAACTARSAYWSPTQILVAVPEGVPTSTIQVIHGTNGLSDLSNDGRGPRLPDFAVNGQIRPGLCSITPGGAVVGDRLPIRISGVNLGNTTGQLYFNQRLVVTSEWRSTTVGLAAPLIPAGGYQVYTSINGVESNPVQFAFDERVISALPVIESLQPATGTVGTYVTIIGRNFGPTGRVIFRDPVTNFSAPADTSFPAGCGTGFWSDGSIMVKVPRELTGGLNERQLVRAGNYEIYVQRDVLSQSNRMRFTVFDGAPGPGICGIQPVAGPIGTGISVLGEHFGSGGVVTFAGSSSTTRPIGILAGDSWRDQQIQTRVPAGAASGMVQVQTSGRTSNGAFFTVGSCQTSPGICGTSNACCPDGSCAVGGVCPLVGATTSTFAWITSTGRVYQNPRVVDECTNQEAPSPSPRSSTTCVNAQAVVRFTTHIEGSTLRDPRNVQVLRCTGVSGDACATGTPASVAGTIEHVVGRTQDQLIFSPTGDVWAPNTTYQIILKTGIRATADDGARPMLEDAARYGTGNAYSYRFTTRNSADLCAARSVSVVPSSWIMQQLNEVKDDYRVSARADDMCVQLNPSSMRWGWSLSSGRASIRPTFPLIATSSVQTVTGLQATDPNTPVLITAELTQPVPPTPVRGTGELTISIQPPRVVEFGPNCDLACVNAAVWARFNVPMDPATLMRTVGGVRVPNVEIKPCLNESCRTFGAPLDLSQAVVDLEAAPGQTSSTNTFLKIDPTVPGIDPVTRNPIRTTQLEPGKYYKVTILGGLDGMRAAYGRLPLTGLNDNDPIGYSWKFRVKTGVNPRCTVDRVQVSPAEKYESTIGARQLFLANPVSAPDSCSQTGQILSAEQSVDWTTSAPLVADFYRLGVSRSSITITDQLPNACTNQCLNAGSNGVYGRTAVCGNATVETGDINYCRRTSDRTQKCLVNNADCETPFGQTCRLLPPGSTDSEECDGGAECSAICLWNPTARVTDSVPGSCGNGRLDRGEQCDVGRACVGGATAGRDCTAGPAACGTGSTCQVVERQGCSDRCQALGSNVGRSTCGNADLSDGETCDYNAEGQNRACTSSCLHRGSSSAPRRLCGNGIIEAGESCEVDVAGGTNSRYCHLVGGVKRCEDGTLFAGKCDAQTCLNVGTSACLTSAGVGCCGNNAVDAGEECDGGPSGAPGCSARCLVLGSSVSYPTPSICGDRAVGTGEQCDAPALAVGVTAPSGITNRQLFEIVGLREPTSDEVTNNQGRMSSNIGAVYQGKRGQSVYGVQCNFAREDACRVSGTGLTSGGCCSQRPTIVTSYPDPNEQNVCRNALISAEFNQLMDEGTLRGNFLISFNAATTCPTGTTDLNRATPTVFNWQAPFRSLVALVQSWFTPASADVWCSSNSLGTVQFERERNHTIASLLLDAPLNPNTPYQVTFLGDPSIQTATVSSTRRGIRSANGVYANGNLSWTFTTGPKICVLDELRLNDTNIDHPTVFYKSAEAHRYVGRAVSHNGTQIVPLSPIRNVYDWTWSPWASSRPNVLQVATHPATGLVSSVATTTAQNQRGTSLVGTGINITTDVISATTTAGRTLDAKLLSTVLLCDNPWVPPGTAAGQPPVFQDPDYHFAFQYCLDDGQAGVGDDLPAMVPSRLVNNPADASRGVLRQYIFSFDRPALRNDAIGLRILSNPLHLSPKDWYTSQGFTGRPVSLTIDGYEAIRDGSSVYIEAANVSSSGRLSTDIYVLSRNANSGPEAQKILDQVLQTLTFNTNILRDADNVCRTKTGAVYRQATSNQVVNCTADWECVRYDREGYCASSKDKLQRDLKRIADLQYISNQLESAKQRDGRYPTISSGSFLQTFVTSRWPSWQSVFASAIGKALPEDPLNVNVSCGRCLIARTACMENSDCPSAGDTCQAVDGFDPGTCWNATSSTYRCPVLEPTNARSVSRMYQYRSVDSGNRFQLGTELEYLPIAQYDPAISGESRRCVSATASNGQLCRTDVDCTIPGAAGQRTQSGTCTLQGGQLQFGGICTGQTLGTGGICGDGVVGGTEICEPGQTSTADCPVNGVVNAGSRRQVCRVDCSGFVSDPAAQCIAKIQCGNNRVETGETCDDGALNGTYGHCNRTCSGFSATCGDGLLSAGETCDLGTTNGNYCDTRTSSGGAACTLNSSCGADCQSVAPHCGDGVTQTESISGRPAEQCDGDAPQTTTSAVCTGGSNAGQLCTTAGQCPGGACGSAQDSRTCTEVKKGLCAGGTNDRGSCNCAAGNDCTDVAACGSQYRCIMYPTRRTKTCAPAGGTSETNQCNWSGWSACLPANFCGDGVIDQGEDCDDANRNDNDRCTNRCRANTCGDNVLNVGVEECDYGTQNGQPVVGAGYGSTVAACTSQCRMTASSGGFCGDGRREASEQCDGGDLGNNGRPLTCSGIGADYALRVRCSAVRSAVGSPQIEVNSTDIATLCDQARPIDDIVTCSRTCGYAGCGVCSALGGNGVITATVKDAVFPAISVPAATVTLLQNGRRIATQTTDATGVFTFSNLNNNQACGGYRVLVEFGQDNPLTNIVNTRGAFYNEGTNGGYWTYESDLFSVPTFRDQGIQNRQGLIYLIPRVGVDEAMAVHTWDGSFAADYDGRYLLTHLILPQDRAYGWSTPFTSRVCPDHPFGGRTDTVCQRDIHEQDNGGAFQGATNISEVPYARMFCPASGASGGCYEVATGPQAIRYKINPTGIGTGRFSFYVTDQRGTQTQNLTLPSYRLYSQTKSRVWLVTQNRIYRIDPPTQAPAPLPSRSTPRCSGKYWLAYQQDAATGEVTINRDQSAYQCGGERTPGDATEAGVLPTNTWPTNEDTMNRNWLNFGGIRTGYSTVDWDPAR